MLYIIGKVLTRQTTWCHKISDRINGSRFMTIYVSLKIRKKLKISEWLRMYPCHISMERSRQDEQLDAIACPLAPMGTEINLFIFAKTQKLPPIALINAWPSTCHTSMESSCGDEQNCVITFPVASIGTEIDAFLSQNYPYLELWCVPKGQKAPGRAGGVGGRSPPNRQYEKPEKKRKKRAPGTGRRRSIR